MELLDTTLREGEQCYGVFFPIETKKRIACLLDAIDIDFIEVGHPAAAPSIARAVSEITALGLKARLIAHARLDRNEIQMVKDLGPAWVGLFSGINALSLDRYGLTRRALFERISASILHAKELGLSVRFTCEDASRTDRGELVEFYGHLQELGTDRMSYADTVGIDTPASIASLQRSLDGILPFDALHFHFHNDLGNAFANAVTAIELGAQCIDASILGIGERTGVVALEDLLACSIRGAAGTERTGHRYAKLLKLARELVSGSINHRHYEQRAFAHKSGIHIHGILKDPVYYEPVDPASSGHHRSIVLSKLMGRAGLRSVLSRFGIEDKDENLMRILDRIKAEEFLEIADAQEIDTYLEQFR
jgi:isopropylmalate/homocitrate/citramalate synthase